MAGGIAEWVVAPAALRVPDALEAQVACRGGAWTDWRVDCNLAARRSYYLEERSERVGFRLVREVE
jgi:formylglycine-generating enzyme required for sulfatase activity